MVYAVSGCGPSVEPLEDNWEKAVPFQTTPQGLPSIRAEDCGICHKAIYEEWKVSTHAHAWIDLQFQSEIQKENSPYLCINCHIPLENQQEYLIKGLVDGDIYQPIKVRNPDFDPVLQNEGISCSTCHVRDGYIIGKVGYPNAPHPVKVDSSFLNEQLCMDCHNANAVVTPELVCTFQTGDEWKAGPYYGQKNCISCHMDTVSRPLMEGMTTRNSHRHWFPGSGIPKRKGLNVVGLQGMKYAPDTLSSNYSKEDSIRFQLTLTNAEAGHRLPTGDPERFYTIILSWTALDSDTIVVSKEFRIGETWEWYPEAKKLSDNNMDPHETRTYRLHFKPDHPGAYRLNAKVSKHRMDEKTADYNKLTEEYPLAITEFVFTQTVSVY